MGCGRSRDGPGREPWLLSNNRAFQARCEGVGDDEVSRLLLVGLCTAACTPARGFLAGREAVFGPRFRGFGSGLLPLAVTEGQPSLARGTSPRRGRVFDRCARALSLVAEVSKRHRAQRSRSGCGRDGGRGPSYRWFRCWDAKGCRQLGEPETASSTKGLWRATCWWKVSWVEEAKNLHGLLVEWILAIGFGSSHVLSSRGDRGIRVAALSCQCLVNSHTATEGQLGKVGRMA